MADILEITLGEAKSRLGDFDRNMREQFSLPPLEREPIHADERALCTGIPDADRLEQAATHLQMLGYLEDSGAIPESRIGEKLNEWEADAEAALREGSLEIFLEGEVREGVPHEEARLRTLKAMATFEGEVVFRKPPEAGGVTLASRIAHMRLIAYGLSRIESGARTAEADHFAAGDAYGPESIRSVKTGSRIFFYPEKNRSVLETLNLLGHAPAATDAFLAAHGALRFMVAGPPTGSDVSPSRWRIDRKPVPWRPRWTGADGQWKLSGEEPFPPETLPAMVKRGPHREPDPEKLHRESRKPLNVVAFELLQMRLWMFGYYQGEIDGQWGSLTEEALKRFLREHGELLGEESASFHAGWGGWRVVNLYRIFGVMVDALDVPSEQLTGAGMRELAERTAGELTAEQWAVVAENHENLMGREARVIPRPHTDGDVLSNGSANLKRKRYFGWRRFFSAAGSFLRGLVGGLVDAVGKVVRALLAGVGHAFEVLRYLWRKVRVAARIARLAVRRLYSWLTGTPVGTSRGSHVTLTRWSLDFDTVEYTSPDCPEEVIARHRTRLHWMRLSFSFMSDLGLLVLSLVTGLGAGLWLRVAYTLYIRVGQMLRDPDYRELFSDGILERGLI